MLSSRVAKDSASPDVVFFVFSLFHYYIFAPDNLTQSTSQVWVSYCSLAGIVDSNPAGDMDVRLL
jgi:hypothetical protein